MGEMAGAAIVVCGIGVFAVGFVFTIWLTVGILK